MPLSEQQQFEMFADIKKISANCIVCKDSLKSHEASLKDHEKRIVALEETSHMYKYDKHILGFICGGVGAIITWLVNIFIK